MALSCLSHNFLLTSAVQWSGTKGYIWEAHLALFEVSFTIWKQSRLYREEKQAELKKRFESGTPDHAPDRPLPYVHHTSSSQAHAIS